MIKNITKVPILINAENPTLVDSWDCNFALNIAEMDNGIKDKIRICKLKIPSTYFGKNSVIKIGDITIMEKAHTIEIIITYILIFLCFAPEDSSESKTTEMRILS